MSEESEELSAQMRSLEYDISKQLARIDDINKQLEQTTYNY